MNNSNNHSSIVNTYYAAAMLQNSAYHVASHHLSTFTRLQSSLFATNLFGCLAANPLDSSIFFFSTSHGHRNLRCDPALRCPCTSNLQACAGAWRMSCSSAQNTFTPTCWVNGYHVGIIQVTYSCHRPGASLVQVARFAP